MVVTGNELKNNQDEWYQTDLGFIIWWKNKDRFSTTTVSNQSITIVILPLPPPQFCFILSDIPELKPESMTRSSNNPKRTP